MATLRILLFGGLHLTAGEQALPPLSPPKLISLLAYLLLHRQPPVTRDQLAEVLWPDESKTEARANLRRHLHLLRQALPPGEWVLAERDTLQWNPAADCWLDVEAFSDCIAPCANQDPRVACQQCLELYAGDLLPELYDDWLVPFREKWRGQYLQVLSAAITHSAECGEYAEALQYAQRLLVYDPLHEETHRMVMRLHYLSGDRLAALKQFEECQTLLHRELSVEPMPATLELQRAILAGQPLPESPRPPRALVAQPVLLPASEIKAPPQRRRRVAWILAGIAGVGLILLLAYSVRLLTAPPSTLELSGPTAAEDTWITEAFPNDLLWPDDPDRTPHAKYSRAHLQYFGHPNDRILIRFDLKTLPDHAQIEQATFAIHLETWIEMEGTGSLTQTYPALVSTFQILRPWQADLATFNQPWTQPGLQSGVDYTAAPLDTQRIDSTAWLSFNVSEAARQWLRQPDTNYGLMLEIAEAPEDMAHYWVDMTDQPTPALRPVLRLSYRQP